MCTCSVQDLFPKHFSLAFLIRHEKSKVVTITQQNLARAWCDERNN